MMLRRPLRRVRVHAISQAESQPASPRATWLLDLRVQAERETQERARVTQAVEQCTAGIQRALGELPGLVQAQMAEVAGLASELGLALAREVVGEIVDREIADPVDSVQRCLEGITQGSETATVRVFLPAQDVAEVSTRFAEDASLSSRVTGVEFVVDDALEHGSARVETSTGRASYDPMETIDRVCAEVRKGLAG